MLHRICNWLLTFLCAQLIVTLISIPILVAWGMPISMMTFLGNLFFIPFFLGFMIACSLLLCAMLLGLPTMWCIKALELIVAAWHLLIAHAHSSWLVAFAHPGKLVLIILFIVLWGCFECFSYLSVRRLTCFLGIVLLCVVSLLKVLPCLTTSLPQVANPLPELFVIKDRVGKISVIDAGYLSRKRSVAKTLEYDLKPYLIKHFGTRTVDEYLLVKSGRKICKIRDELSGSDLIDKVIMSDHHDFARYLRQFSGIAHNSLQKLLKRYSFNDELVAR